MRFLDEDDENFNDIEGLTINCIELVATLVTKETLYMLIKLAVFPIINALAHFILLTQDQVYLFISNYTLKIKKGEVMDLGA